MKTASKCFTSYQCCHSTTDIDRFKLLSRQVTELYKHYKTVGFNPDDFEFITKVGGLGTALIRNIETLLEDNYTNRNISDHGWNFICDFYQVCCEGVAATRSPNAAIDLASLGVDAQKETQRKRPYIPMSKRVCSNPIATAMSVMGVGYTVESLYFLFGS